MKPLQWLTSLAISAGLALAGCQSSPGSAGVVRLLPEATVDALKKGMTIAEVRALLGEPQRIAPFEWEGRTAERWTYRVSAFETPKSVLYGMQDVPNFDPISGKPTSVPEPIYRMELVKYYNTVELLILDGRVIGRDTSRERDRPPSPAAGRAK